MHKIVSYFISFSWMVWFVLFIGWFLNIYKLLSSPELTMSIGSWTGMFIARIVGVFTPLGGIIGYM